GSSSLKKNGSGGDEPEGALIATAGDCSPDDFPSHDDSRRSQLNKFLARAMAKEDLLRDCRIEDVRWLCSLSESELLLWPSTYYCLLSLMTHSKLFCILRIICLFKILPMTGFILMEHLKGQLKDVSIIPGLAESSSFLDGCNILNSKLSDTFSTMDIEELRSFVGTDQRKRLAEM
ncbi:hypothetical protein C3L33_12213, partial [Rhododendron williamsianum]